MEAPGSAWPHFQAPRQAWATAFARALLSLVLVEALLLQGIVQPNAPSTWSVAFIHPIVQVGAAALLMIAGQRAAGLRRWAWRLLALAFLLVATATLWNIQRKLQGAPGIPLAMQGLFLLSYSFGLIGTALVFPQRWWRDGSILRVVLDSALIAYAAIILLDYGLPLLFRSWVWTDRLRFLVPYLGLDTGLLFATLVCCARFGRNASVLTVPVLLGFGALLLGEIISLFIYQFAPDELVALAVGPLYALQSVLVALGAYRSTLQPLPSTEQTPATPPLVEWALWAVVPRVFFFAAVAVMMLVPQIIPFSSARVMLLAVAAWREGLALWEQRRVQRALHTAQAEARHAAQQTEDFLSRMIHDLAAPLLGMRAALAGLPEEAGSALRIQFAHLDHLYTQLHSYLRARTATLERTALDLTPICEAALHAAAEGAAARQVHLCFVLDADATEALGDATAIRRVLDNLLTNAVHVSPPNGEIVLSIGAAPTDSRRLLLTVRDEGPGIPPDQHERIFAPLVRLRNSNGLGVGLSIVQELVCGMNGRCGVWSVEGAGSTFWVELPREQQVETRC